MAQGVGVLWVFCEVSYTLPETSEVRLRTGFTQALREPTNLCP